jgi:hypothetical protein
MTLQRTYTAQNFEQIAWLITNDFRPQGIKMLSIKLLHYDILPLMRISATYEMVLE